MTITDVRICATRGRGEGWHLSLELGEHFANALTSVAKDNYLFIEYED